MRRAAMAGALGVSLAMAALASCHHEDAPRENVNQAPNLVFRDPETCRSCHAQHVAEWEGSMHAYAAKDPMFHGIADVMTADFGGELASAQFCTQCHTVPGVLFGETTIERGPSGVPAIKTEGLSKVAQMGVSCDVCHSATRVTDPFNANIVFEPDGRVHGPFGDAMANDFHASIESPMHRSGDFCAGCHDVVLPGGPGRTVPLESTGKEWKTWISQGNTKQCQDCHMPVRGTGPVVPGGPSRPLHAHTFVGVDTALVDFPHQAEQRALVEAMLKQAATLSLAATADGIAVTIANQAGHALPSGSTTERRAWLEVTVRDEGGAVVFRSGNLDANGDLMDGFPEHTTTPAGDPQLLWFGSNVTATTRDEGKHLVPFPHEATEIDEHLLAPGAAVTHDYSLASLASGKYVADVRLLYRPFQPYFLREMQKHFAVKLDPAIAARVPTFVIATATLDISR